jgi:hypothetical protein
MFSFCMLRRFIILHVHINASEKQNTFNMLFLNWLPTLKMEGIVLSETSVPTFRVKSTEIYVIIIGIEIVTIIQNYLCRILHTVQ